MASTAGARPLHLAVITETYPREINGVANTMYELVFGMEGRRVDTQRFSPDRRREDLRAAWGCGPRDLVLLYIGRIAPEKNLELIRATLAEARAANSGMRGALVGDGPGLSRLRRTHSE